MEGWVTKEETWTRSWLFMPSRKQKPGMGSLPGAGEDVSPSPHEESPMTNKRSQVTLWCWKGDAVSVGHVKEQHPPWLWAAAPALLPPSSIIVLAKPLPMTTVGRHCQGRRSSWKVKDRTGTDGITRAFKPSRRRDLPGRGCLSPPSPQTAPAEMKTLLLP